MVNTDLVTWQINVDDTTLQETVNVAQLHVTLHNDQESIATFVILLNSATQESIQLPEQFKAGASIEILLGYENNNSCIFAGELSAIELKINAHTGVAFYISGLSDKEYEPQSSDVLSLTYGDNLYEFDGVAHLDEPISDSDYLTETELRTQGTANVLPGDKVSINGCSNWFDGEFDVKTVGHSVADGNWETQLVVSN